MTRAWAIDTYKSRLDSAIESENWEEADRIRLAAKQRLVELIASGASAEQVKGARDALVDSSQRLRLSKSIVIEQGPLAMATRFSADIETAAIAVAKAPLPQDVARNAKERIVAVLSSGNRRVWSTSELAEETKHRVETVARAIAQLRAEGRILSRRSGRSVGHRLCDRQRDPLRTIHNVIANAPLSKDAHAIWAVGNAVGIKLIGHLAIVEKDGVDSGLGGKNRTNRVNITSSLFDSDLQSPAVSEKSLADSARKMRKKYKDDQNFFAQ